MLNNKEGVVAFKREKNLKEVLTKADTYNSNNLMDNDIDTHTPYY